MDIRRSISLSVYGQNECNYSDYKNCRYRDNESDHDQSFKRKLSVGDNESPHQYYRCDNEYGHETGYWFDLNHSNNFSDLIRQYAI